MRAAGARRVLRLPVSGAFHSPLMAGVADELATAFEAEEWHDAARPGDQQRQRGAAHRRGPDPRTPRRAGALAGRVGALRATHGRRRRRHMIECGAGAALVGMVRRIAPDVTTATVADAATLDGASSSSASGGTA